MGKTYLGPGSTLGLAMTFAYIGVDHATSGEVVKGLVDLSSYSFALPFPLYPHSKMTTHNRTYQQLPLHSCSFSFSLWFRFQKSSDFNRPHKVLMFRIKSFAILLHVGTE
jgi:hypothetical protein